MKRLLPAFALVCIASGSQAQCTPNQLYADSVFGVWPDTTENFVPGMVDAFYSDTINVLVPSDATLVSDLVPPGTVIDSIQVTSVSGLPPGLTVDCNSHTGAPCSYLPNTVGCGLISGTPTTVGIYSVTVNVLAFVNFFGFPASQEQAFPGYEIVIAPNSVGISDHVINGLGEVSASPNPFEQRTNIRFMLSRAASVKLKVFNMLGEEVWNKRVDGKSGLNTVPFEPTALQDGVYLYKVESLGHVFTGRMVVDR
jgi:hypothetical protein